MYVHHVFFSKVKHKQAERITQEMQQQILSLVNELSRKEDMLTAERVRTQSIEAQCDAAEAKCQRWAAAVVTMQKEKKRSKKAKTAAQSKLRASCAKHKSLLQIVLQHRAFHMWRHTEQMTASNEKLQEVEHELVDTQRMLQEAHQELQKALRKARDLSQQNQQSQWLAQSETDECNRIDRENQRLRAANMKLRAMTSRADNALQSLLMN